MLKAAKSIVKNLLNRYPQWICRQEFESQVFTRFNERPIEFGFVFRKLGEIYPRNILDVGTGTTALPHLVRNCGFLVTATDNVHDYWPSGMLNRHYHVVDDDITNSHLKDTFGPHHLHKCPRTYRTSRRRCQEHVSFVGPKRPPNHDISVQRKKLREKRVRTNWFKLWSGSTVYHPVLLAD